MKFGPVAKIEEKNKIASKDFDNDFMFTNCYVIDIFASYDQFGPIGKDA